MSENSKDIKSLTKSETVFKHNKNQTKNGFNKDSFDRFGDDLSELLLSYLTIDQKVHYESVCKQWQRLVYNKHQRLFISSCIGNDIIKGLIFRSKQFKHLYNIKKVLLQVLLKKFKSINEIVIDNYCIIDGQIIRLITDNCLYLKRFICTSIKINNLSEDDLKGFGIKFSQTLRYIQFDGIQDMQMQSILRLTPFVNAVNIQSNNFITQIDFVFIDLKTRQLLSPKLDTIYISCYSVEDIKAFANQYRQQIKKIEIKFMSNYLLGNIMNQTLKELSRFVNLESLSLLIYNYQKGFISPINDGLKMIATNCLKLKHFVCEMTRNLIENQLFDIFYDFRALETCKLSTTYENLSDYGSLDCFKNCQNLTHLTLYLKYLSDKHVKDINKYLPKLRSFKVNTSNGYITDNAFHSLSKLSELSTIEISGISSSMVNITDDGVCQALANCQNIRSVSFFCKTSITQITINEFINKAKSQPKINHRFFYESFDSDFDQSYDFIGTYPRNLMILSIPI